MIFEESETEFNNFAQSDEDYKHERTLTDERVAPDTLIIQITQDLKIGLKTQEIYYILIDNIIDQLNNRLFSLRDIFQLRCVEVIYGGILMSKIWNNNKRLITIENIQQLVIGSFLIAHKYTGDHTYKNKYWAQALGISIETINSWESDILKTVNFEIFVDSEVYYEIEDIFRNRCDNEVALSMGCITN